MILSVFVPSLMRSLFQMAKEEVGQLLGVPGEIERLSRMISRIQSVLVDAERRQMESAAIKRWVMELKDVMYDADDIVDLFQIKAKKRRVESSSSSSSDASWWSDFVTGVNNPVFAHEIASKIKALDSRMDEIMRGLPLLDLIENIEPPCYSQRRAFDLCRKTHPVVVLSDIVGNKIEEDTEQLVQLLTEDVTEGQGNIPIVAIEGMGGIGKTTLAKMVYNDPRIIAEFKPLIWICVSKELRPVDVLKNVIRKVGGDCGGAEEISELMPRLEEYIQGKKFFLVLDDVWPESERVWYGLLRDPMSSGAHGSSVLITTRDGRVAMWMRAIHTHKVKRLSDEDGWSLLVKQVTSNGFENEIQDIKDIGMQIVKKCDGLPLAIKSIGGVLCIKDNTRNNWQAVLTNNVWSMNRLPGDVHHALYLSYEDLSPPLKQCFIFCSLFPEDFEFKQSDLIHLWLAEGFLQNKRDFWELGSQYFSEIVQRNLLGIINRADIRDLDTIRWKMHDILWCFARQLGNDENCVLWKEQDLSRSDGSLKVRRLLIEGNEVTNIEAIKKEKGLRTILLRGIREGAIDDLCKCVSKLRILKIGRSYISSLPDSLCDLMHLRYLDVSYSNIKNLPNSIGSLKYLVYLNLTWCKDLSHLPLSIINLRELRYLNTIYSGIEAFPAGLNKLDKLILLHGFKPNENNLLGLSNLDGLESLSRLTRLTLDGLERVTDRNIAKRANLRSKNQLHDLCLMYTLSLEEQLFLNNETKMTTKDVLNELSPPSSLQTLTIYGYLGNHLPNWLNLGADLPNLKYLRIDYCSCFEELASLGQLPNLEYLLIGAYSVVSVGEEFLWGGICSINTVAMSCPTMIAFPKLSGLRFTWMPSWKKWQWNKGQPAMSKLKELHLVFCCHLRSLPEGLLHHATSLKSLQIERADKLITIENFPSITSIDVLSNPMLERISNLPSISYIQISNCPNLKTVENLNALQVMDLDDYKMETLPEYLTTTMAQKLIIGCREELLLKIASQGESGSEWNKFKHIPKVTINSSEGKYSLIYEKSPFSFTTKICTRGANIGTARPKKRACPSTIFKLLEEENIQTFI